MSTAGLGFSSGILPRLVAVAVFATLALAGVWLVERGGDPPPITAAAPVAATSSGTLVLEATYPVAQWTVQVQGQAITGTSSPHRWEAAVSGDGATIFIQAEGADPTSTTPAALRWTFAGRSGTLWGEGAVAGTLGPAGDGERGR
jgi:hypothetical protein